MLMAFLNLHRLQLNPVRQDFRRCQIAEFKRVSQKLPLVFINAAVLLNVFHEEKQFLMGHFRILVGLEKAGNEFLPLGKKKIQRRQHPNPQTDKGGADHGKAFRRILRHALGGDFTKDQNNDRHNDGGNRRAHVAVEPDKQKRTDRGNHDIHDIVSNQDGRDQLVVIPRQLECQRRSPVSVIRENLQPSLIQRRKCRFCRAEIGGHGNTDDHRQNTSHIIHTKLLDFLFIVISCKKQIQPACVSGQETLNPARAAGLDVLFRASKSIRSCQA